MPIAQHGCHFKEMRIKVKDNDKNDILSARFACRVCRTYHIANNFIKERKQMVWAYPANHYIHRFSAIRFQRCSRRESNIHGNCNGLICFPALQHIDCYFTCNIRGLQEEVKLVIGF
jgi:hypothetical protein